MRVLISGGGTGGHLFPAIAVAQALSQSEPDSTLLYVGRRGGIEERVVGRYGVPMQTIVAAKLDMENLWRNWPLPFVLPRALIQSAR
ncbi:MAG: UDP-N-acetylglucosamine--N-acetylmuramyl-(pentapeptide) pyrophosphoryl-undecaprenol N-acetylglucosamine transferase, partial [Chloroflexi bacterium]